MFYGKALAWASMAVIYIAIFGLTSAWSTSARYSSSYYCYHSQYPLHYLHQLLFCGTADDFTSPFPILLPLKLDHTTKPDAAGKLGTVAVATSHTHAVRIVAPRTAPQNMVALTAIPILTPFVNVAHHIVQTISIRPETAYR